MKYLTKYKGVILIVIALLGLIFFNKETLFSPSLSQEEYSQVLLTTEAEVVGEYIMIDIKGEINNPGFYQVNSNLRVGDIIALAGGVTQNADLSNINLAEKIIDEMVINIPNNITSIIKDEMVNIIVEIKGEVINPGVYVLNHNSRVSDLIELAGGLTYNADVSKINQALKLEDEMSIEIPKILSEGPVKEDYIVVEIKGEVKYPGIYYLASKSRIYDLIEQAGGYTQSADKMQVETARILNDGETIIIPKVNSEILISVEIYGEVIYPGVYNIPESTSLIDLIYQAGGVTTNCDLEKINWDITLVLGAKIYIPSYNDEVQINEENSLININTADLETLINLPSIGDILGQRIIDYRAEFGDFLTIEDITKVSGIKDSIYEKIKEYITV